MRAKPKHPPSGVIQTQLNLQSRTCPSVCRRLQHHPPAPEAAPAATSSGAAFPTTQWSLVAKAGSEEQPRSALECLCNRYWYPIYHFARRQGRAHHEAQDLTQQFFAQLLATGGIATARPERGRFRTFLLTALRNFLTDEWRRSQTAKRGGGHAHFSIDEAAAEKRFAEEPVDPNLPPDQAFDRTWALEMLGRAIERLREEYHSSGRGPLFDALAPYLWKSPTADEADPRQVKMNAHAVSMALNRLRHRMGLRLREEVSATVAEGTDIDSELRLLIAALGDV